MTDAEVAARLQTKCDLCGGEFDDLESNSEGELVCLDCLEEDDPELYQEITGEEVEDVES